MSLRYLKNSAKASKARKVGRQFAGSVTSEPSADARVTPATTIPSGGSKSVDEPARRTPEPSENLFSMQQFSVNDVDQLRQLMQESLTSLAVEIGTQVACCLLEDDVVKRETDAIHKSFSKKRTFMLGALEAMGVRVDLAPQGGFYIWGSVENLPPDLDDGSACFIVERVR